MFETVNNPLIIAGGVLAGIVVLLIICKMIAMTWRIIRIKPGKGQDKIFHYSDYELRKKQQFENRLSQ